MRQIPLGIRIPDRATFASFLPVRNEQAVDHLQRVARGEMAGASWLCGPQGAGKSHLLQATCAAVGAPARAGYLPLLETAHLGPAMLEGLPELNCLTLDDIDAVVGQIEWERALFALLREMEERGGRLIAAAQAPPTLLTWSLADLGSRLCAGTVFQLRALDEAQQLEALHLHARTRGFEIPDDAARWLQRRFPRDMHSLHGLLDTLDEAALVEQRRLTIPFIRAVLRE